MLISFWEISSLPFQLYNDHLYSYKACTLYLQGMKTKSWCFKAVLKAKFIQGVSLALYQNLDGGSEYLEAWFTGNGPRFHTRVHLATFFPLLFPLWGRKLKPLENAWSPWISCCLYEPSTLTLLRTTLSRSPPANFPVPSTQRTCVFFL